MKLVKSEVNWMLGWANRPHLEITVDDIPSTNDIRYKKIGDLYWGHLDGYVDFFAHDPTNPTGFSGRTFDLTLTEGEKVSIKGPWSSRAGAMNKHFPHCVDVKINTEDGGRYVGAITLELAQQAAKMAGVELEVEENDTWGDINYEIKGWRETKAEMEAEKNG